MVKCLLYLLIWPTLVFANYFSDNAIEKLGFCEIKEERCMLNKAVISFQYDFCECFENVFLNTTPTHRSYQENSRKQLHHSEIFCRTPRTVKFKFKHQGPFLLLMQGAGQQWKAVAVTSQRLTITLTHLSSEAFYRVKIGFVDSIRHHNVNELEFTTLSESYKPANITHLTAEWVEPKATGVDVKISWLPASDLTCSYHVICQHKLQYSVTLLDCMKESLYEVVLKNLSYETSYRVAVVGVYKDSEGFPVWHKLEAPPCLQINNNSLNICPPRQIQNLAVSEMLLFSNSSLTGVYDLAVSWDLLHPEPDLIHVEVTGFNNASVVQALTGETTSTVFYSVELGTQLLVTAWAVSHGGPGQRCVVYKEISLEMFASTFLDAASSKLIGYLVASVLGSISIVVLFVLYLLKFRKKVTSVMLTDHVTQLEVKKGSVDTDQRGGKFDEFEVALDDVELTDEVLGQGAFGIVKKGKVKKGDKYLEVAVKMLPDNSTENQKKDLQGEINMLKTIGRHPNIVSLIGCCTASISNTLLLVEYCSKGDLQTYLHNANEHGDVNLPRTREQLQVDPIYRVFDSPKKWIPFAANENEAEEPPSNYTANELERVCLQRQVRQLTELYNDAEKIIRHLLDELELTKTGGQEASSTALLLTQRTQELESKLGTLTQGKKKKAQYRLLMPSQKNCLILGDFIMKDVRARGSTRAWIRPDITLSALCAVVNSDESITTHKPKIVIVQAGSNSIKMKKGVVVKKERVKEQALQLLTLLKEKLPDTKLVLSGILRRIDVSDEIINAFNADLSDVAEQCGAWFADINSWVDSSNMAPDGVHLNCTGSEQLGKMFNRFTKDVVR